MSTPLEAWLESLNPKLDDARYLGSELQQVIAVIEKWKEALEVIRDEQGDSDAEVALAIDPASLLCNSNKEEKL